MIKIDRKFKNIFSAIKSSNNGPLKKFSAELNNFVYDYREKNEDENWVYVREIQKIDKDLKRKRSHQVVEFAEKDGRLIVSLTKFDMHFGQKRLRSRQILSALKTKEGYVCSYDISTYRRIPGTSRLVIEEERGYSFRVVNGKISDDVDVRSVKYETDKNGRVL